MSVNGHVFGTRIRHLREAMDLSLRDLAERSGVSAPMLSQVERGETSPTLSIAERIAAGLELTPVAAAAPRRGRRRERRPRGRAPPAAAAAATATRYSRRRCPGQRAEVSLHTLAPGRLHRRSPTTRPCTRPAAARPPWSTTARCASSAAAAAHELESGDTVTFDADLPHHFENPGRPTPRFYAVVAAGLAGADRCPRRCSTRSGTPTRSPTGLLYIDLHLVHEVTLAAGVRVAAAGRAQGAPARPHARHGRPQRAHRRRRPPRPQIRDQLSRMQIETLERNCAEFGVPLYSIGSDSPGHRARDRAGAGRHPARHDDRLRRLAHLHARRLRRAGVRHRHERGRARARHPDAPAAQAASRCASATRASSATA